MKISKADKQQNIATLYGWKFVSRFGDEQPGTDGKPVALLLRVTDKGEEVAELQYSQRLTTWLKVLARPSGQQQAPLFTPRLWSDSFAKSFDKSVLASLVSPAVNSTRHAPATCRVRIHPHIGIPK